MPPSTSGDIIIKPVQNRKELAAFIQMPNHLYRNDSCWVQRLYRERLEHFSKANPLFKHAHWQAWLAYRDGRAVGRISAQVDRLNQTYAQNVTGYFGSLESEDDSAIFQALFAAAENWLKEQDMAHIVGPINLGINQEVGLLVAGFDTPPSFMMGHALPYFDAHIENCGYQKAVDVLAFWFRVDFDVHPALQSITKRTAKILTIRPINKKQAKSELELLRNIFNDAWSQNWGFLPFTESEFQTIGQDMLSLINKEFIQIVEFKGEAAAFVVLLPNINEAIQDLNGKLFPFGWLKLLWRLKVRSPKTGRVPLMGVRKKYQNTWIGASMAFRAIDAIYSAGRKKGIRGAELSWVLEDNHGMRKIIEYLCGEAYKTYRIYEKKTIAEGNL